MNEPNEHEIAPLHIGRIPKVVPSITTSQATLLETNDATAGICDTAGKVIVLGSEIEVLWHGFLPKEKKREDIQSNIKAIITLVWQIDLHLRQQPALAKSSLEVTSALGICLADLFLTFAGFKALINEYAEIRRSHYQKVKWAVTGEKEAAELGRMLTAHKQSLSSALQSLDSDIASFKRRGVRIIEVASPEVIETSDQSHQTSKVAGASTSNRLNTSPPTKPGLGPVQELLPQIEGDSDADGNSPSAEQFLVTVEGVDGKDSRAESVEDEDNAEQRYPSDAETLKTSADEAWEESMRQNEAELEKLLAETTKSFEPSVGQSSSSQKIPNIASQEPLRLRPKPLKSKAPEHSEISKTPREEDIQKITELPKVDLAVMRLLFGQLSLVEQESFLSNPYADVNAQKNKHAVETNNDISTEQLLFELEKLTKSSAYFLSWLADIDDKRSVVSMTSMATDSSAKFSMEGATWCQSTDRTTNSGFGIGRPRTDGHKRVREGREKEIRPLGVKSLGRTGKTSIMVPPGLVRLASASSTEPPSEGEKAGTLET